MSTSRRLVWLLAQLAVAGTSASIVLGGLRTVGREPEGRVTAALLLPTLVFLVGVRRPHLVTLFGALLVGITGATWVLYELHRDESMAGAGIVIGAWYSLISSVVGACLELADRAGGPSTPTGVAEQMRSGPAADPPVVQPRAW
ncbi:MAG: hypothetical protein ABIS47_09160 [Acidimicrobiales bacterium]